MISKTIFKHTLRANIKLWVIFTAVTSLFFAILIAVFEPATISGMMDLVKDTALGDMLKNSTFLGMMSSTFFTLHGVLLPIVYVSITANGLIAAQVDRGSLAYQLSTPTKRSTIVRTQALYLIVALIAMFVVVAVVGLLSIRLFQSGVELDYGTFFALIGGLFLLLFAISGVSFLFSCIFNLSKHAIALGAGLPIAFFLFDLMRSVSDSLENFKYVTLNTLFNRDAILAGDAVLVPFLLLALVGIVLYGIGIRVFQQKDLPL